MQRASDTRNTFIENNVQYENDMKQFESNVIVCLIRFWTFFFGNECYCDLFQASPAGDGTVVGGLNSGPLLRQSE